MLFDSQPKYGGSSVRPGPPTLDGPREVGRAEADPDGVGQRLAAAPDRDLDQAADEEVLLLEVGQLDEAELLFQERRAADAGAPQ